MGWVMKSSMSLVALWSFSVFVAGGLIFSKAKEVKNYEMTSSLPENVALSIGSEASSCMQAIEKFSQMQKAQDQLLKGFLDKNVSMSQELERLAEINNSKSQKRSLYKTASVFRSHGVREKSVVQRFQLATDQLKSEIQASCGSKMASSSL
jgi:hypothetical protein